MKLVDRKQGDSRIILIVKELAKRIRHHAQGSGLLDGVTFRKTPIALVEGVDQLPAITMMEYTDVDNYFDGAKTGLKKSTNVIRPRSYSPAKSIKSLRTYQLGVVYIDQYGRETPVFSSSNSTFKLLIFNKFFINIYSFVTNFII